MIIHAETPDIKKYRIYDCAGHTIPLVQAYNTETKEVTLCIQALNVNAPQEKQFGVVLSPVEPKEDGTWEFAPVTLTFVLPGSYATFEGEVVSPGEGMHVAFKTPIEEVTVPVEQSGDLQIESN